MKTTAQIDQWFTATLQQENTLNLGIYWQETNALIGYAGLSGISATNHSGEYFIFIGEKAAWGKGVGTAVTKQILHLGFTSYQLNRIMLTVSESNTGGVKAYTKAGFVTEGRLRQAAYRQGVFHDKIVMSVLKAEWQLQGAAGQLLHSGEHQKVWGNTIVQSAQPEEKPMDTVPKVRLPHTF